MTRLLMLILGLCVFIHVGAVEIHEGCFVKERIKEEDLLFDTFEVTLMKSTNKNQTTNILVKCSQNEDYDLLMLTSSNVTHERVRSQSASWKLTLPVPEKTKDWTTFQLGLKVNLTLLDDIEQSWLPQNATIDCPIKSVELDGGYFVRHCPQGTPSWKLGNGIPQEIPLQENVGIQKLTLISRQTFSPVIVGRGSNLTLGMANGKLTTDQQEPLPPGNYQISIEAENSNSGFRVKVSKGDGEATLTTQIQDTKLFVLGKENDKFVIVKSMERVILDSEETELKYTPGNMTEMSSLFLIPVMIIIIITLVFQLCDLYLLFKLFFRDTK